MVEREHRNEFGLPSIGIPAEVLFHPDLSPAERILFGFIRSLNYTTRGCWASNDYLGLLMGRRADTISTMISHLEAAGFIIVSKSGQTGRRIKINTGYVQANHSNLREVWSVLDQRRTEYVSLGKNRTVQSTIGKNPKDDLEKSKAYRDRNKDRKKETSSKGFSREEIDQAVQAWNDLADEHGLSKCIKLTDSRKGRLIQRLQDCGGLEAWKEILSKVGQSSFLLGKKTDWRASFDFVLQPSSFVKLIEGQYDDVQPSRLRTVKQPLRANKPKPGAAIDGPRGQAQHRFGGRDYLVRGFLTGPFRKARKLLPDYNDLRGRKELARVLLDLFEYISDEQERHLNDELRDLIPGRLEVLESYITWIGEQDWISDRNLRVFNPDGGLFARFRKDAARRDPMLRDPLTGESELGNQ